MERSLIVVLATVALSGCENEADRFANENWPQYMSKCASTYVIYRPIRAAEPATIYECKGPRITTTEFAAVDEQRPFGVEWYGASVLQCSAKRSKTIGEEFSEWSTGNVASAYITKRTHNWEFDTHLAVTPDCSLLGK